MGNIFEAETSVEKDCLSDFPLTPQERGELETTVRKNSSSDDPQIFIRTFFTLHFSTKTVPDLDILLYNFCCFYSQIKDDKKLSFAMFEAFVANGCRGDNESAINFVLGALLHGNVSKTFFENLNSFFCIMVEMSYSQFAESYSTAENMQDYNRIATQMTDHFNLYIQNTQQNTDYRTALIWIKDYFPWTNRAIVGILSKICFPLSTARSSSTLTFRPVAFMEDSSITSPSQMFPLSLHSSKLQGCWKKLYTTDNDGIFFRYLETQFYF